jgi:Zn-dependent metalloprotease
LELIDFTRSVSSGTGNWRIGEDITTSGLGIRNMQNPNEFSDPDTYEGIYWASTSGSDNGGVHTNSGVQNFWFYLLCEGGNGVNDNGDSYNVLELD